MLGGVADGSDLDFSGAGGDADDDLDIGGEEAAVLVVYLLDEAADHHFRSVEVCDDAVPERAHGAYAGIVALVHQLSFLAYCDAFVGCIIYSDDTRLVKDYLVILVDDGVGGTEVDGQFLV